jgi:hypothetical protein
VTQLALFGEPTPGLPAGLRYIDELIACVCSAVHLANGAPP